MLVNTQNSGLCTTCNHAADCTLAGRTGKAVLFCEEYDAGESCEAKGQVQAWPKPKYVDGDEDSGMFLGLCRNCENRRTCAFPKPEGGIWHCEEYQ